MKTAMQELWEYIEANYNEENFNIFDAKAKSLELEKKQIIITDKKIDNASAYMDDTSKYFFKYGAKWYREQLKNK
jgi:hypothetical protein